MSKTIVYINDDTRAKLDMYCLINKTTLTNIINIAIKEYLDRNYDYNKIKDNIPK